MEYVESLGFEDFSNALSAEQSWITIPVFCYSALIITVIISKIFKLKTSSFLLIVLSLGVTPLIIYILKDWLSKYISGIDLIAIVYIVLLYGIIMVFMFFISLSIISINKRYSSYTELYSVKSILFVLFSILHLLNSYWLKGMMEIG